MIRKHGKKSKKNNAAGGGGGGGCSEFFWSLVTLIGCGSLFGVETAADTDVGSAQGQASDATRKTQKKDAKDEVALSEAPGTLAFYFNYASQVAEATIDEQRVYQCVPCIRPWTRASLIAFASISLYMAWCIVYVSSCT